MINGENPDPILQRVRALIAAKRYDEAMLDLSLAPESAGVRNLMGLVALKRRKFRQAEEYLRRALELEPDNYEATNNLGLAVARQRSRRREAIDIFTRAAELNPSGGAAHENLHDTANHWLQSAGLIASFLIFRLISTAWMKEGWQGMWNPWIVGSVASMAIAIAYLIFRKRRSNLPERARMLLDREAARTRRARTRNAIFDGLLFLVFFGGMFWAIEENESLQQNMGLRAVMFLGLLAVGVTLAGLFRRITGSPPEA
jgi:tetratricopeptide (TPR) repeat protein